MRSFKGKLILLFVPIYLLFSVALSLFSIVHHYKHVKSKIIEKGVAVIETLSHACEFGAVTYDKVLLDWATREIRSDKKVLQLVVYDPEGHVLFSHNEHGLAIELPTRKTFATSAVYEESNNGSDHTMHFTAPIKRLITLDVSMNGVTRDPLVVGYIRMVVSTEELDEELRSTLMFSGGLILFLLVPGVIAIIYLSRQVTRPIEQLSLSVRRFGEGNLEETVELQSKDEIGQLAYNFNNMANSLREAREKLQRSRDELEQMVAVRTGQLKESEERYRRLIDSSPDPILVNDLSGKVTYVNPAYSLVFGWAKKEIVGKYVTEIPNDRDGNFEAMHQKIIKGEDIIGLKTRLTTRGGDRIDVGIKGAALYGKDGWISGSILVLRDMTEENKLKEQLMQAQKMEALGTLAGGVAHDLNNILSGVVNYPELILMNLPEKSSLREKLTAIQTSGEKAAAVVQDLLTLARRGTAIAEPVNVNEVISEFMESPEFHKISSTHPQVSFQMDLAPEPFNILGSPLHLGKTLMNLVINGAEAIEGKGVVRISSSNLYVDHGSEIISGMLEGDYTCLQVSDTGVGISREDCQRIYEPFFTKKVMGRSGTGLGMAVVWGAVQDHKGFIDLQSNQGEGTTFTLYFPATQERLKKQPMIDQIDSYRGNGETVLVVDDIKEQRKIASAILVALGYEPITLESGEEAVAYLRKNQVDLVIIDMIMDPGMDGLETYEQILKITRDQKVIIASGYAETERVKRARELGIEHYVRKPYLIETIGVAIKQSLGAG